MVASFSCASTKRPAARQRPCNFNARPCNEFLKLVKASSLSERLK
eukprot:CAMPEP_0180832294 /NCGR_PEP_ID=MMETSP1038_2-20121128/76763_1 /TAXON_ID=632150 /ORGANISM="Azadinium spinosum, Strain 3D9" /LENGTH=44 /DNA_ID= /DNA_START= /DNA_END= /DNA_ORIENTATION=